MSVLRKEEIIKLTHCRVCKQIKLEKVLNLGPTPLANAFLTKKQLDLPEKYYPLDVYFCHSCSLLQLGHVVSADILFSDYVYVSSTSPVFVKHFEDFAEDVFLRFGLNKNSLVVDIGSNDGILLKPLQKKGAKVLGVEPAKRIAKIARKDGIETIADWFTVDLVKKIVQKKGHAKIVTATNVFAHIHDLDEVIRGLDFLLSDDGVFIMEAPYLIDFLEKRYFDLVYHEHLSYWAVRPLITLFKRFNMKIIDVQKVAAHGGSIRVFVVKNKADYSISRNIAKFLAMEDKHRTNDIRTYHNYAQKIQENKISLLTLLGKLKIQGKKIAAYGAPAKGNTILNFFSVGTETLDYAVDDSKMKQGLFTPGKHIPVLSSKELSINVPDYLLILAWNFANPIIEKTKDYKRLGGKYIVPVPIPKII